MPGHQMRTRQHPLEILATRGDAVDRRPARRRADATTTKGPERTLRAPRESDRLAARAGDHRVRLGQSNVVPRRIAERRVDAVRSLLGRLAELDALVAQLLVRAVDVVRLQEERAREALGHELADLLSRLR